MTMPSWFLLKNRKFLYLCRTDDHEFGEMGSILAMPYSIGIDLLFRKWSKNTLLVD